MERLWVDQYGNKFYAMTQKELKTVHGIPGKVSPMYIDRKDGVIRRIGVVIGKHWLTEYTPREDPR